MCDALRILINSCLLLLFLTLIIRGQERGRRTGENKWLPKKMLLPFYSFFFFCLCSVRICVPTFFQMPVPGQSSALTCQGASHILKCNTDHLGILLTCKFRFLRLGWGLRICIVSSQIMLLLLVHGSHSVKKAYRVIRYSWLFMFWLKSLQPSPLTILHHIVTLNFFFIRLW